MSKVYTVTADDAIEFNCEAKNPIEALERAGEDTPEFLTAKNILIGVKKCATINLPKIYNS